MTNIPTLKEIYESILQDLQSELGITIPLWKKSFIKALAAVQASKIKLNYLALANVQKNVFPDLADPEISGGTLERFGRAKLGRNPLPPTQGKYIISIKGDIGAFIPVGTTFKSNDNATNPNILYILDMDVTLSDNEIEIEVRALTSGIVGRQNIGDTFTITAPIVGVDNEATLIAESVIPNEGETMEEYRSVVMSRFRMLPQGGAPSDYRIWAQDASGVKQTYPYASSGNPGEVDVYVESSIVNSIDGKGTPSATTLADVALVLETDPITGQGRRPLGVYANNVMPVEVCDIEIEIPDFQNITPQIQQTISDAITNVIDSIRPFVAGADVVSERNDTVSVNLLISTILSAVPGSAFSTPIIYITLGGVSDSYTSYKFELGKIPFLNSISYV